MSKGRPPKYNPQRCHAIITSISNRVPYEIAAEANGIHPDTLYDWINKGRKDRDADLDTELSRFSEAIKKVEQERIIDHLNKIADSAERWQSQAWILERRWSKYFGANAEVKELSKMVEELMRKVNGRQKMDTESNQEQGCIA